MGTLTPINSDDVVTPHYSLDDLPNFKAQLSKAKAARIRYAGKMDPTHLPRSRNLPNTVQEQMQYYEPYTPGCPVDDIIQGIARLDHDQSSKRSIPLSVSRLYAVLQCMPLINTREVMAMLDIEKRQAQKYVKALNLCLFFLNKHFARTSGAQ